MKTLTLLLLVLVPVATAAADRPAAPKETREARIADGQAALTRAMNVIRKSPGVCGHGEAFEAVEQLWHELETIRTGFAFDLGRVAEQLDGVFMGPALVDCPPAVVVELKAGAREVTAAKALPAKAVTAGKGEKKQALRPVQLFQANGEIYVRAGSGQGLAVGLSVKLIDAIRDGSVVGEGKVLEVSPEFSRLLVEKDVRRGGPKFALLALQ